MDDGSFGTLVCGGARRAEMHGACAADWHSLWAGPPTRQVMRDTAGLGALGNRVDRGACTRRCAALPSTAASPDVGRSLPPAARLARSIRTRCGEHSSRGECTEHPRCAALVAAADSDADEREAGGDSQARHRHVAGVVRRRDICGCSGYELVVGARRLRRRIGVRDGLRHRRSATAPRRADCASPLLTPSQHRAVRGDDDSPDGEPVGLRRTANQRACAARRTGRARIGRQAAQIYSTGLPVGGVAQLVERFGRIEEARGSIPLTSTSSHSIAVPQRLDLDR